MKTKIIIAHLALFLAVFLSPLVRANDDNSESDASGHVRVDVVVDMTEAGHKVVHPTPEKPAYYLPLSVGYKEFGYAHNFQRPPPNAWDIEHALAKALYSQGYQLMTKEGHPSLVLVFWWGYMSPDQVDMSTGLQATAQGNMPNYSMFSGYAPDRGGDMSSKGYSNPYGSHPAGPGMGDSADGTITGPGGIAGMDPDTSFLVNWSIGSNTTNGEQMLSMVAGNTINDHQKFPDPRLDDVVQMSTAPRYFVLVSAFDFNSWLHHKPILLWRAHVSTELWGHYFDQVVGTLISAATPLFGRETKVPHFINAATLPLGRVILGTPEVKDYPAP